MTGSSAPLLSGDLLNQLESRWRAQHAPLVEHLAAGLDDAQIDELTRPLGLRVPPEARAWWRWHNGVSSHAITRRIEREMVGSGWAFLPLGEAVERTATERRRARETAGEKAETLLWRTGWLVVAEDLHGGVFAVDCIDAVREAAPIYYIEGEIGQERFQPRTRTFGEMITWWIEGLDDGTIAYDATSSRWNYDWERLDPQRELTRLV